MSRQVALREGTPAIRSKSQNLIRFGDRSVFVRSVFRFHMRLNTRLAPLCYNVYGSVNQERQRNGAPLSAYIVRKESLLGACRDICRATTYST